MKCVRFASKSRKRGRPSRYNLTAINFASASRVKITRYSLREIFVLCRKQDRTCNNVYKKKKQKNKGKRFLAPDFRYGVYIYCARRKR